MGKRIYLKSDKMAISYDTELGGIVSLKSPLDDYKADFVLTPEEFPEYITEDCKWLGNVEGTALVAGREVFFSTGRLRRKGEITGAGNELILTCPELTGKKGAKGVFLKIKMQLEEEKLHWRLAVKNTTDGEIVFRELYLPLLMNQNFRIDDDFKYDRCVMRHTCITGHSSYLYWEKSSGNGPVLVLTPTDDTQFVHIKKETDNPLFGAKFTENSGYEGMVKVYAACADSAIHPDYHYEIRVGAGETKELHFVLSMLEKEEQIPDLLKELFLATLKAVPGMVGPVNRDFLVMTQPVDAQVSVCDGSDSVVESYEKNGFRVSRIKFGGCGRRYVQVRLGDKLDTYCFFATEAIQDIIDNHAAFIAKNHFETDENDPCYHGLLMWDMIHKRRINASFNPYFEDWWRGGSDDPGLASGLFLSEKNVYRAREEEIKVLNDFIEDFIIGRLTQQPGYRVHRMVPWFVMFEPWAGRGADDVWRAFNYVHVVNMMRNMYLIQKQHEYSYLRPAREYLDLAYHYTKAMFNYWMYPDGVGASQFGNMGEMTLPLYLAEELKEEGMLQEAAELDAIFDKKADYFNSRNFPFGSEMVYDSTAFEAVYGYGRRIESDHIMRSAARASYSNRGKQPVWFLYNTDLRGGGDTGWNSSYMTQLGAYPILDYCLEQGHIDENWILSYYGAYLAGWLIYNSGGYWDSQPENKGATGWITIASLIHHTGYRSDFDKKQPFREDGKLDMPLLNGCVALSGEAGIGFFGALKTACSIVMNHSVLGKIGLGCQLCSEENDEVIIPEDGLSMRVYHVIEGWKLEITGGYIKRIIVTDSEVKVDIRLSCETGMKVSFFSIPQNGETQKLLWADRLEAQNGTDQSVVWNRMK